MVRIATWGCEIQVIRPSRVLDPALQTSKNEKSRQTYKHKMEQKIIRNQREFG